MILHCGYIRVGHILLNYLAPISRSNLLGHFIIPHIRLKEIHKGLFVIIDLEALFRDLLLGTWPSMILIIIVNFGLVPSGVLLLTN